MPEQKKLEDDKAREKELNDLFKVAVSQPKVPVGMLISDSKACYFVSFLIFPLHFNCL